MQTEHRTIIGRIQYSLHSFLFRSHRYLLLFGLSLLAVLTLSMLAQASRDSTIPQALFIPLDDRPSTFLFPQQIARIGGGRLLCPPEHLLGNAYTPGNTTGLSAWLDEQATKSQCRVAVISTDMLAYGGLIASRTGQKELTEALASLECLDRLHAQGVKIIALSILPRLSLRTSEEAAPYEEAMRNWATRAQQAPPTQVPQKYYQEYLKVRQRNNAIAHYLIGKTAEGVIDRLVLGQDDASKTGLHLSEQQAIRELVSQHKLESQVTLVSGADELAMNLVSGWLCRQEKFTPSLQIYYLAASETAALDSSTQNSSTQEELGEQIPPMESLTLDDSVNLHLKLSGAVRSQTGGCILYMPVPAAKPYAPPVATEQTDAALSRLICSSRAKHQPFGVADLRLINRADPLLAQTVLQNCRLWQLEAYAAWNTPSNSLGTAIAQASMHSLAQQRGYKWSQYRILESEKTHLAFSLARLIDDYAYQALIRPTLNSQVAGLPRNPEPLLNLYGPAGLQARASCIEWAKQIWEKYLKLQKYYEPRLKQELQLEDMQLQVTLPWPRVFEIEAKLNLRLTPLPQMTQEQKKAVPKPK